jgi:hypothetical protein
MNEITRLTDVRKRVEAEVKENFGSAPNTKYFNDLIDEMRDLEFQVKALYPNSWRKYENKHY